MSYSLLPAQLDYPPIDTPTWVVISRLSEEPIRTVPSLDLVNHASEVALPFPTGVFPLKVVQRTFDAQAFDDLNQPLYDDGMGGTTSDVDIDGNPFPPLRESVTEESTVSLQDSPNLFSAEEVFKLVENDFLKAYPFYTWAKLIIFDDRIDGVSTYQGKQRASGFGSGSHPLFLGPFVAPFDTSSTPRGHLVLIAPRSQGFNYYFQIRHGVAGGSGFMGPIEDIAQASRQGEVYHLFPMENLPISDVMLTDSNSVETSHFWLRSADNGIYLQPDQLPVLPWLMLMGRKTGLAGSV